jgi:hypothetical protein
MGLAEPTAVSTDYGLRTWTDIFLTSGSGPKTFHVRRLKGSNDSVHTLDRDEVSALRKLKANSMSPYVFTSERGGHYHPT